MSAITNNTEQIRDSFTDLNSLNAIKKMGRAGDEQALKEVAKQFEALFVQQLLKTMRATEDVFSEGNYDQSSEMKFHRDLMDQQMSLELTKGSGMGLADALFNQLKAQYGGELEAKPKADTSLQNVKRFAQPLHVSGTKANTRPVDTPTLAAPEKAVEPDVSHVQKVSNFVHDIYEVAQQVATSLGVKVESVVAQAALETGWGLHTLTDTEGNSSFNFFNIKAGSGWQGKTVERQVKEYDQGREVVERAQFRAYPTLKAAFTDFLSFIDDSPRYQQVAGQASSKDYGRALQNAGYATDPQYAEKIQRIAESPILKSILAQKLL